MISIRCSDVDEVLRALDDLSLHQTVASPSPRINGFVTQIMTWAKTYARACHIFVGVIAVADASVWVTLSIESSAC